MKVSMSLSAESAVTSQKLKRFKLGYQLAGSVNPVTRYKNNNLEFEHRPWSWPRRFGSDLRENRVTLCAVSRSNIQLETEINGVMKVSLQPQSFMSDCSV
jgi:hypothetical protein